MNVYSTRFFGHVTDGSGVYYAEYVVPTGFVAVVRDATFHAAASGHWAQTGEGATGTLYRANSVADNTTYQWKGRQVFLEGETLWVECDAAVWSLHVSGYLLAA